MAFKDLLITEIFHSLQGETSLSGLRFAFIRLTGCNLRCGYCDSVYAFKGGQKMTIPQVLKEIEPYEVKHVLITGGEPLLQRNTPALVQALKAQGYSVSIETHGEVSIAQVAGQARLIMDIKTPGSQMCRGGYEKNLPLLKGDDEIKFVITSRADYAWARDVIQTKLRGLPVREILFSPVILNSTETRDGSDFDYEWLAQSILDDRLPVRLQLQLHKIIWGAHKTGV